MLFASTVCLKTRRGGYRVLGLEPKWLLFFFHIRPRCDKEEQAKMATAVVVVVVVVVDAFLFALAATVVVFFFCLLCACQPMQSVCLIRSNSDEYACRLPSIKQ